MLTEVKNQIKVSFLSIKYALLREMLNKTTFITNVIFMILNNASMIVQWIILYSLKENVGGYTFKQVLLLWGLAAGTFGVSRFFFSKAFSLSDTINSGKLDAYLVQPKNVLLSVIAFYVLFRTEMNINLKPADSYSEFTDLSFYFLNILRG